MPEKTAHDSHSSLMDGIYSQQRHIYDFTRKYYLLGRDHTIKALAPAPGQNVLEVGCGTGRNLIHAAKLFPQAHLYGLDISHEMLKTARTKIARSGLDKTIMLEQADATHFQAQTLFGQQGFDRIMISYAVSMIPAWEKAIEHAATQLNPGGQLHIVDFGMQDGLPKWFRAGLHRWLKAFHVVPRSTLNEIALQAAQNIEGTANTRPLYRDYARHSIITRAPTVK